MTRQLSAGTERPDDRPVPFADQQHGRQDAAPVRRLGSMHAGQAAASATFDGTLLVTTPSGEQLEVGATFDTGSDTDAVSVKTATKLIGLGCS